MTPELLKRQTFREGKTEIQPFNLAVKNCRYAVTPHNLKNCLLKRIRLIGSKFSFLNSVAIVSFNFKFKKLSFANQLRLELVALLTNFYLQDTLL